ncbi:hypothetical protein JTB14_015481 [Gonioctena quinquepunctata]|nr:hypothetical protein JTB14_015481 [Gonioctena quinquepunctata]
MNEGLALNSIWYLVTIIEFGMGEVSGDHKLWVSLSALGDGNVFAILPQLMKQMLSDGMGETEEDFADVILPSDNAWQTKIYYQLVEKQRLVDATSEDE